jgi:hypothetical protein
LAFPTGLTYLGFVLRQNLLLYSSNLLLGFPTGWSFTSSTTRQQVLWHHSSLRPKSNQVFWRRCRGGKRRLLQGEFRVHILYFVLSFALLYFYLFHFIKNTKKLVSL